jgi:hypothetical protein
MLTSLMVVGTESLRAEEAGLTGDAAIEHAIEIRDAVIERLGMSPVVKAFIDCDYEMRTSNRSDAVAERALEVSGYNRARAELFPETS